MTEMPSKFGLAPMEGVSDLPFRLWISLCSDPEWTATPFLRVTDSYPARFPSYFAPETNQLAGLVRYRLTTQLMAARPADFVRVAQPLLAEHEFIELNCGCPSPNPVGSGAGSSLLRDSQQFAKFIAYICDHLGADRLAVKMRLGFETNDEFKTLLDGIVQLPLRQLTVHARTRKARYAAYADWEWIQYAARQAPFPVIGSGDILGLGSLRDRAHQLEGIERIIIGRGVMRNPWIFLCLRQGVESLNLPVSVLKDSLICYLLLVDLYRNQPEQLLSLAATECFLSPCLDMPDAWRSMRDRLMMLRFSSTELDQLQVLDRAILGRLKLVWNYLRSSLPEELFSPGLLRSRGMSEFFGNFEHLLIGKTYVDLRHRPELDWIYTSDKKDPGSYRDQELQQVSLSL